MVDFRKCLSPEKQKQMAQVDEFYEGRLIAFRNMKTTNLLSTAKYYMTQMKDPYKYKPGEPVYDSVFWHLIIPEMMRRLEKEQ
jgi:hypothetical protein